METDTARRPTLPIEPLTRLSLVERVRQGVAGAALDRECAKSANSMPDHVGSEDDLVRRVGGLADARRMRDAIVLVLALLGELDELMPDEPDRSAFHEIADLFQDISEFAAFGVKAARQAAGGGNS
ncbi:hypothetical protein [Mesorhizobium sp.]|uniref:hypothetical protein n=1 Tax=Mesorhizobium sp. TaxID=1871066 RepID=UPI000FEAABE3|nr:hypothetical protein [Mesorhizobium sp.]RWN56707.1 MAG: hypothetical protein EOR98_09290 [Mesorhizobium sp.]RWN78218.1 MAG: hypothetical protein EOS02_10770 [Mesorhizobium sp.]RWN82160.1 MAG: hypothetical protein EOS01_09345 [Mesorhizobium sp.]RWO15950.1 MAG: hypothetical protein EOS15_09360 [Mesorhizobium sp.]RWO70743.1 MAG: hypothetical protein EOS16_08410 [Mesorhizobium sp.]